MKGTVAAVYGITSIETIINKSKNMSVSTIVDYELKCPELGDSSHKK